MKKSIIYYLSPFNNETNMSGVEYIIKKLLAFILIYGVSAVLGEGIIIGILFGMVNELKEKVLTDKNKQKAKRGLKIVAIILGIIVLIDVISMIVYFSLYGFPQ